MDARAQGAKKIVAAHAVSFALPFLIIGAVFAGQKVFPFGTRQILIYDFWQQYYPFIVDYWHKLREGGSMLWSWSAGVGDDYIGHFAYLLASPLNALIVLFPLSALREVTTVLLLVKIGLSGLFMSVFLRRIDSARPYLLPAFASCYALCAFTVGYNHNIMWFDGFALLPLVMLGLRSLVREDRGMLYAVTLAVAFASNYIIGFFICLFVAIMFFYECVSNGYKPKEFLRKLLRIAVYTVPALGMGAFVTLPAIVSLGGTAGAFGQFPKTLRLYESFASVLGNMTAFNAATARTGLPNIYCGLLCAMLLAVYAIRGGVPLKERTANILILAFILVSCNVNALDFIWNGFHFTNMLPFRFAFLFSFLLVSVAYKTFVNLGEVRAKDLCAMAASAVFFVLMAALGTQDLKSVVRNATLCAVYVLIFFAVSRTAEKKPSAKKKMLSGSAKKTGREKKRTAFPAPAAAALALLMLAELTANAHIGIAGNSNTDRNNYPSGYDSVKALIDKIERPENDFFRTEFTDWQTLNDPMLFGINGASLFSSSVDASVPEFMRGIGLSAWGIGNRYCYADTSPLTNALLCVRYLVARSGNPADDSFFYEAAGREGDAVLLKNKYSLPFGFMVMDGLADYAPKEGDPFASQNLFFNLATGLEGDLFTIIDMVHVGHSNYFVSRKELGEYSYTLEEDETGGRLKWNYLSDRDASYFAYADISDATQATVTKDAGAARTVNIRLPNIFNVGMVKEGEIFSVAVNMSAQSGGAKIYVAYIDRDLFLRGYEILSSETYSLASFGETKIAGSVSTERGGLLYTSLPHQGRWTASVDGAPAEIVTVGGCMAAVRLPAGTHSVEFKYLNPFFVAGACVSVFSLVFFVLLVKFDPARK
ncbi:MAG: YfhO family protein [Defluviitaleaceae bacterium]|nr:YfhO family protein [Defluviitaleaceae bacterium]